LIDADPQGDSNVDVESAGSEQADQVIELGLIAEASEDDFRCEAGIAGAEFDGMLEKKVGCIAAIVDLHEYVKRDLACGRDQVSF
jgi:hypothetical protein